MALFIRCRLFLHFCIFTNKSYLPFTLLKVEKFINESMEDFKDEFGEDTSNRSALTFIAHKIENEDDKIAIFFLEGKGKKIGVQEVAKVSQQMKDAESKKGVIVVKGGITPSANDGIKTVKSENQFIQVFKESELLIDITEHELVPEHEVLSSTEEKKSFGKI